MGFISNVAGTISDSINSEINDQYLESFRTDSLGQDTLVRRAYRQNSRGRNQGSSDVITAGSKVLVPEGTYALMIDEGKIADVVTEPGLYTWENSSSASVFSGNMKSVMGDVFDRFRFAGEYTKTQKIFYINGLEIMNQTCNEYLNVPYPDPIYGTLYFKFRIMFSFRIVDPAKFFKKTGKTTTVYEYMGTPERPKQPILEVQDHMEEALNLCATRDKIPFPKLLSNKSILKDAVNEAVSKLWHEQRGMVVETITIVDLTLDEKSRARVEQFDSAKLFSEDPAALNALVALGFTDAMKAAASNPAGAITGFAGVGMANSVAGNTAPINTQSFEGLDTCPFCGTSLNSGVIYEHCPACNAEIRSYYQH
ncbi:MAG: SPFH domain-containing protein [Clostridiales bacterium]|nr:SPFH domain-containing protein [Clostridiales bacterium]